MRVLLVTFIVLVAACAGNGKVVGKPQGLNSQFDTSISESGFKTFSLKATISRPLSVRTKTDAQAKEQRQLTQWLEQELNQKLASSGFCKDGHTEIERSIGLGFAIIRGECNDLAPARAH